MNPEEIKTEIRALEEMGVRTHEASVSCAPAAGSPADREFEKWWARNIYAVRDISEQMPTQHERLKTAARMVWHGARRQENDKVSHAGPTASTAKAD